MRATWAALAAVAAGASVPALPQSSKLPPGPGAELVQKACAKCHALEGVLRARHDADGWGKIVDDMVSRGAVATDDEIERMIVYLSRTFGPKVNVNTAGESELTAALFTKETAATLIAFREKNGAFKSTGDLEKAGVNPADIEQLRGRLVFE
jgi:hypothetical protein